MKLYLIRHGQTAANVGGVYPPDDTPLTDEGEAQAREAAHWFSEQRFDEVFISPLPRAVRTAELLGVKGTIVPALRDHDMGEYIGKPFGTYKAHCRENSIPIETYVPKDGESYAQARNRVNAWLSTLKEGNYLVVSHTDTMCWIVAAMAGVRPEVIFDNMALWIIDEARIEKMNWKPWLEKQEES